MLIIIERELGTYDEADLMKEVAYMRMEERKRLLRLANHITTHLPEKYLTRRNNLIAKDVSESYYQELKKYLETIR